jgi:hypothetical protein
MDFSLEYTEEQEEFAAEVREWIRDNIPEGMVNVRDPAKKSYEQWQKRRELGRRLGQKGWLYAGLPKEYGGGGLDADRRFVLSREFERAGVGYPPFYDSARLAVGPILALGTEEQKRRFLPPILKGEVTTWQLFTEPEAGTDEANQQTDALRHEREGDHFIVNGGKVFVGGLYAPPDQFLLLTRSDRDAPRHENLAMFLAPANVPGVTINPLPLFVSGTLGQVSGPTVDQAPGVKHQVFFDDVRIHESYLIGGERDGWRVTTATLDVEHGGGQVGVPSENAVLGRFLEQCRGNPRIRRRLERNPQLLETVADIYIGAEIQRLWGLRNSWFSLAGVRAPYVGPQLGLYTKEYGGRLISDLAKVLGPYSFTEGGDWALAEDIFEVVQRAGLCFAPAGTPEAQKIIISRALAIGREPRR